MLRPKDKSHDVPLAPLGRGRHHRWMVSPSRVSLVRPVVPPRPTNIAAQPKDVQFDAARTALVVVDMQNDFMHPEGWFALRGANRTPLFRPVEPLRRLLPELRRNGVPVIWLGWGCRSDGLDLPPNVLHSGTYSGDGLNLCDPHPKRDYHILEAGSWGSKVIDELPVEPEDIHVFKSRLSGFWGTDFDAVLRNLGMTTLLFAGVNLDRCVMSTLQDASFIGYDCILVDDCCATRPSRVCNSIVPLDDQATAGICDDIRFHHRRAECQRWGMTRTPVAHMDQSQ